MGIRIAIIVGVSMAIIIALILSVTSPTTAGPLGVLAFFACMYLFSVCLFYVFIVLAQKIAAIFFGKKNQIQSVNTSGKKSYYYSTVIALVPPIYVGMQSVGDAGLFEMILLLLFELLACFYVYKRY